MDSFASSHTMLHGILNSQHNRRNRTSSTQKRNVSRRTNRSLSLLDRRGLITAPRFPSRKSSISPLPHHKRQDMDSADMLAMLMHLSERDHRSDPFCAMFLPSVANSGDTSTPKSIIWEHIQRTASLPVQSFLRNVVGEVLLTLRYHLLKNVLIVDVIQVKDITRRQNCSIFLSVQLLQSCKVLEKYETSSKRLESRIYFKKTMQFNVPFAMFYSNDTNLLIKVCQDTKNADEIGHLVIGPQGNLTGVHHWRRIFSIPNTSFSAWHKLTSAVNHSHISQLQLL
uniref:C2 domain-containing protein n=1 Tax=Setaria digitata TaxID=48799 RepID=A0A915PYS5_9BILA